MKSVLGFAFILGGIGLIVSNPQVSVSLVFGLILCVVGWGMMFRIHKGDPGEDGGIF